MMQEFTPYQMEFAGYRVNEYIAQHGIPISIKKIGNHIYNESATFSLNGYEFYVYDEITNMMDLSIYAFLLLCLKGIISPEKTEGRFNFNGGNFSNIKYIRAGKYRSIFFWGVKKIFRFY